MEKFWAAIRALLPWSWWGKQGKGGTGPTGAETGQRENEAGPKAEAGEPDTVENFCLPPAESGNLQWLVAEATAQGARPSNQDASTLIHSADGVCRLCVVADGMGGASRGEDASKAAVAAIGTFHGEHSAIPDEPEGWFRDAFAAANRAVITALQQDSGGTTLTVVSHERSGRVGIAHVGDSPVIHVRGSLAAELTKPHTVAQKLLDLGMKRSEIAREYFHTLLQYLGTSREGDPKTSEPDCKRFYVRAGDWLVICSDGLTNVLVLSEIATVLKASADPEQASAKLMELALSKNPRDNVTFVLVQYLEDEGGSAAGAGSDATVDTTGSAQSSGSA